MSSALLKGLSEERIVLVKRSSRFSALLGGIVRLVDTRGNTLGLVLNAETLEELEEDRVAMEPAFVKSLERSRRSGRVPGSEVRKKVLG